MQMRTERSVARVAAASLERALRARIAGEVRFDPASRALYSTAASNYRQVPIGVVVPKTADDVVATVAACREHDAPLFARGGGTSLAGQCCNVAVVIDFSKYLHHIVALDPQARTARVQPGVVLDHLRAAAERHNLTFAPDPATHSHNTLGGMIGNNSCGIHSVMGGKTVDNVIALDVLTYDGLRLTVGETGEDELATRGRASGREGEIYAALKRLRDAHADEIRARYPRVPRRVSGYNLDELLPENRCNVARALVGTESTCVLVLEALLRLVPSPPARALALLAFEDVFRAADAVPAVLEHRPVGLEGMDDRLIDDVRTTGFAPRGLELLPPGRGWLLVEFGGAERAEAEAAARKCADAFAGAARSSVIADPAEQALVWKVRESSLGATAHVPGKALTWEGWEDAAVPPARLGAYLREFAALLEGHGLQGDLYGHFGDGCVHVRIDFDFRSAAGIARYRAFIDAAADLVVRHGGSLSGEHGDGQSRAILLPKMFGDSLVAAFGEYKRIWDPTGRMNPGKIVDPYAPDENLRVGPHYAPRARTTQFAYPEDGNDFNRVMLRCVGIGECRRHERGTICPSYRVTREERHSTRGRARLLFEMTQGDVLHGDWREQAVKDALDLCLSCKGCKGDCPVRVDMVAYKAEFLSHFYAGRPRPRAAYTFGLIDRWARLGAHAPNLANRLGALDTVKRFAGIATERAVPRIAPQTFRAWFARREHRSSGPPVVLWTDTFTSYFHTSVAQAAVSVIERAGFTVRLPREQLCCGRPLYEYGMLDRARRCLERILGVLAAEIAAGTPIVVLEPACAAVFRDELARLFPGRDDARRLAAQVAFFAEFVDRHAGALPRRSGGAIVHAHCNQKALIDPHAGRAGLERLGIAATVLDSGCCGMAGGFGFTPGKVDISKAIGETVLLPAVRAAGDATLVIADGFSCREQIAQCTGRRAMHLAEVLAA